MKDNLRWKMTLVEDNLWWKTASDGRQPLWKTAFDRRRLLIEDDLWPPSFNQLEFQGPYGLTKVFTVHTHTRFVDLLQINLIQTPTTVGFPPRPPQRQPLTTLLGFNYFFEVGTDKKFFLCDTHTYIKVNIRTH